MTIDPEDAKRRFEAIKANHAKLKACPKHFFGQMPEPPYRFGAKLHCHNCGGDMQSVDVLHYVEGYMAAGKDPSDIVVGLFESPKDGA